MGIVDEYFELKESTDADLLAMQVGDFYEFFADDAYTASGELGLKVSEKSSHGSSYAMAGVPIKDLQQYVTKLVERGGYTVAVADQYEEDGNHKREISRIATPGTLLERVESDSRYLGTLLIDGGNYGMAVTDVSSGRIYLQQTDEESYLDDLAIYNPDEILIGSTEVSKSNLEEVSDTITSYLDTTIRLDTHLNMSKLQTTVTNHFGEDVLPSLNIDRGETCVSAVGWILTYLEETGTDVEKSITQLRTVGDEKFVSIDARTRRSLEITETINRDGGQPLVDVLDETMTSFGGNKLERYLQRPLKERDEILDRQESVSVLVEDAIARRDIRDVLEGIPNLPRIASRAAYGTATPRDISQIVDGIEALQELCDLVSKTPKLKDAPLSSVLDSINMGEVTELQETVENAIPRDPPNKVEIGMIREGFDDDLDEVIREYEETLQWFSELEDTVKREYDVTHVTVDRNKTDGYYIQVGKSESDALKSDFEQIKTLKTSHRFESDELRKKERKFLRLEEERKEMEEEAFEELLSVVANSSTLLQSIGDAVAHIDALQSFAVHAVANDWVKPKIRSEGEDIAVQGGRHPVVEQTTDFVPNDIYLSDEQKFIIVTGPNMAGKSTYLRQTALVSLLGQTGGFVPAESAELGIVDAIFTRVGAMDEISQGRSTFMVEMAELANILHTSTDNSLVLLDEVGRGTATEDGISIAKATVEYLTNENPDSQNPNTLFATHYHELTSLSETIPTVKNVHVAVESTSDGSYEFLYKVRDGPADKSYGIKVAELAGVPNPVISRSNDILSELHDTEEKE